MYPRTLIVSAVLDALVAAVVLAKTLAQPRRNRQSRRECSKTPVGNGK